MKYMFIHDYISGVFLETYPESKNGISIPNELLNKNIWRFFEPGDVSCKS